MQQFLETYFGKQSIVRIEPLAQAGSDRKYLRIHLPDTTYIVCESSNVEENETFLYFTNFFRELGVPVPEIISVNESKTIYIQEDLGLKSLLQTVDELGHVEQLKDYYKASLKALVPMQILGGEQLDFSKCYATSSFDKQAVLADLNYFKYYFLDLLKLNYNKSALNTEFDQLASEVGAIKPLYFMFRDFQGRNIMIHTNKPVFIDYQGGMRGPLQYDVASLLWQAKASLPSEWKQELYEFYKSELSTQISFDEKNFDSDYAKIVLIRLLQVLGAYGLRGLIEYRSHFLSSIPLGISNIEEWISQFTLTDYPELSKVLNSVVHSIPKERFIIPKANSETKLKILVQSFSYKKGIPEDPSGNGGGFMFDCRGVLNPGRFEPYKKLTGRDQPVKDFLESQTRIAEFLKHAKAAVDISVEDYLQRGFEHLMISFGCTGGQHRSVYCTDAMARHLKEKYNINAEVRHLIQDAKNWVNE